MDPSTLKTVMETLLNLFDEAWPGPKTPNSTWFNDNEADAGILGRLAKVDAELASRSFGPGPTIAAHAEHLRWYLAYARSFYGSEGKPGNWEDSWSVRTVDQEAWDRLRADLRTEYEAMRLTVANHTDWSDPDLLTGTMALLPHSGYHLGAIRELIRMAG